MSNRKLWIQREMNTPFVVQGTGWAVGAIKGIKPGLFLPGLNIIYVGLLSPWMGQEGAD